MCAARRIRSIEKSNYLIGNRNRDLPACSIILKPATLPYVPILDNSKLNSTSFQCKIFLNSNEYFQED
jgi:hypothetical protein